MWRRPGWRWAAFTGARYELLTNSSFGNIDAWIGNVGVQRQLNEHTILMAGYVYGREAGAIQGYQAAQHLQGANLVVSWTPRIIGLEPIR